MSKKGTTAFMVQRGSAILLAPFALWFLISAVAHVGASYDEMRAWLASPLTKLLLGGFVTIGAVHMRVGMMEVIGDYIHGPLNGVLNLANWIAVGAVVIITWLSLFTITA